MLHLQLNCKLQTARTICGFSFDGTSDINIFPNGQLLPIGDDIFMGDGNEAGCLVIRSNSTTPPGIVLKNSDGTESGRFQAGNISGNAASATKLQNIKNINGVAFDGTKDISLYANEPIGFCENLQQIDAALTSGLYLCSETPVNELYGFGFLRVYRIGDTIHQTYYSHNRNANGSVARRQKWDDQNWSGWTNLDPENAYSASKLQNTRNIALAGAVSGNADFDGSGNIQINTALNNFSNNKNSNGYTYLGNGLILQWGTFDVAYVPGEDDISFNFNLTFPNACLNMTCTRKKASGNSQNGDGGVLIVDTTAANFTVSLQTFNTSNNLVRGFTWFAVGY